jgi:hypothetical protein
MYRCNRLPVRVVCVAMVLELGVSTQIGHEARVRPEIGSEDGGGRSWCRDVEHSGV